jgi:hypothetical protein
VDCYRVSGATLVLSLSAREKEFPIIRDMK